VKTQATIITCGLWIVEIKLIDNSIN